MTTLSLAKLSGYRFSFSLLTLLLVALASHQLMIAANNRGDTDRSQFVAKSLIQQTTELLDQHHHTLSRLAADPELAELLSPERERDRLAQAETIKAFFPHALKAYVLLPDTRYIAGTSFPLFDAACENFLDRANTSLQPPAPELHWPNAELAHIDIIQPLRDHNRALLGHVMVRLDAKWLQRTLSKQLPYGDYLELRPLSPAADGGTFLPVGSSQVKSGLPAERARVGKTNFELAYWPQKSPGVLPPDLQFLLFLALGTAAVVWTMGALIIDLAASKSLRHDLQSVAKKIKDVHRGATRIDYPVRLAEFKTLLTYINKAGGKLIEERRKLKDLGLTDHISQLPNRRALEIKLEQLSVQAKIGLPSSLLLIDIDRFKRVNDNLGHDAGDTLIMLFAQALKESVRNSDFVTRLGGDEFCILFPHTELFAADELAGRIRQNMPRKLELKPGVEYVLRWTGGLSSMDRNDSNFDQVLWRADKALLQAKVAGRNQTWVYEADARSASA